MAAIFTGEINACAALLIAAALLELTPKWFRWGFVVIVFGIGMLAAVAGFGTALADTAVSRLFG